MLALFGGPPAAQHVQPPRWPAIDDDDVAAVVHALRFEELSAYEVEDGPLDEFESALRRRFESPHALLVSSGTAALHSAYFGLGLEPGSEVVVPTSTFPGTAAPLLHLGVDVRFADVDPETGNPSPAHIAAAITPRTSAVVVAHAWGLPADLDGILDVTRRAGVPLVEDCARAFGTRCGDREVGTFGVAGAFSFHEMKAVPAGEGGLLLTPDVGVYERAVALGHYFRSKSPRHLSATPARRFRDTGLGLNLKIHPLAAALARSQLSKLDDRLLDQAAGREKLTRLIEPARGLHLQEAPAWAKRVSWYAFNLLLDTEHGGPSRDTIVAALRAEGVQAKPAGTPPLHRLPLFGPDEATSLPGRAVGPWDDAALPGAVAHDARLVRLSVVGLKDLDVVEAWADAVVKVASARSALIEWEQGQVT